MSPTPTDLKLYKQIKENVYKRIPTHSAYRSGILVKEYKRAFYDLYPNRSPYLEKRSNSTGLSRWFAEEWTNQDGEIGYHNPGDIYRPNVIVNRKTPKTFAEMTYSEVQKARRKKYKYGRVDRF